LPATDKPIVAMAAQNGLWRFEQALRGTIDNFPVTPVRWLMRFLVYPLGGHYNPASDRLCSVCARLVLEPGEVRDRMTRDIFVSEDANDPTGILEVTLKKVVAAEPAEKKLEKAIRAGTIRRYHGIDWIAEAASKGVITESEAQQLGEVERLVARVIAVDHFDPDEIRPQDRKLGHNSRAAAAE
jgi:acyl-CoA dehydrogenase